MDRHLKMPTLAARVRGRRVAAYRTLRGAALATQRLTAAGHDARDVTVRPVLLHADRTACRRLPDQSTQRRAAAMVAAGVAFIATVSAWGIRPLTVLVGLGAAGVGAITGVALVVVWRRWSTRRIERAGRSVHARAFEVVVTTDAHEAEHELATWWDPEAPPTSVPR